MTDYLPPLPVDAGPAQVPDDQPHAVLAESQATLDSVRQAMRDHVASELAAGKGVLHLAQDEIRDHIREQLGTGQAVLDKARADMQVYAQQQLARGLTTLQEAGGELPPLDQIMVAWLPPQPPAVTPDCTIKWICITWVDDPYQVYRVAAYDPCGPFDPRYTVRAGPYDSEGEAENACSILAQGGELPPALGGGGGGVDVVLPLPAPPVVTVPAGRGAGGGAGPVPGPHTLGPLPGGKGPPAGYPTPYYWICTFIGNQLQGISLFLAFPPYAPYGSDPTGPGVYGPYHDLADAQAHYQGVLSACQGGPGGGGGGNGKDCLPCPPQHPCPPAPPCPPPPCPPPCPPVLDLSKIQCDLGILPAWIRADCSKDARKDVEDYVGDLWSEWAAVTDLDGLVGDPFDRLDAAFAGPG